MLYNKLSRSSKLGIAFLCAGLLVPTAVLLYIASIRLTPLDQPLNSSLKSQSFMFQARSSGYYQFEIEAQRGLNNEAERGRKHLELSCRLGLQGSYGNDAACSSYLESYRFDWFLTKSGSLVAQGTYGHGMEAGYSNDTIEAIFENLQMRRGRYELRLANCSTGEGLSSNHLRIKVGLEHDPLGPAFLSIESFAAGILLCAVGTAMLLVEWIKRKRATR